MSAHAVLILLNAVGKMKKNVTLAGHYITFSQHV